jgi:hypothetical protein
MTAPRHAVKPWLQFLREVLREDLPALHAFLVNALIVVVAAVVLVVAVAVLDHFDLHVTALIVLMMGVFAVAGVVAYRSGGAG